MPTEAPRVHSRSPASPIAPMHPARSNQSSIPQPSAVHTKSTPNSVTLSGTPAKDPPAILLRDKKQKACANCRRAKLKCIFGDDTICVRCKARKEQCVSYPRAHVRTSLDGTDGRTKGGSKTSRRTCTLLRPTFHTSPMSYSILVLIWPIGA